eukprot:CAMPEP_0175090250 /NCGR_PEP_ID=MMETSP0086_2-20121207/1231_1 /TAXON_ID=136419 /ORGANISM="Unknown Unknown, Strain D1" /LENGTH=366 /DNA_ID=CAMNT_0016362837 /DNA_START=183 /DNA_END=1283 /DNA_ORIENTATION=-
MSLQTTDSGRPAISNANTSDLSGPASEERMIDRPLLQSDAFPLMNDHTAQPQFPTASTQVSGAYRTTLPDSKIPQNFNSELEALQKVTRTRRDLLVYKSQRVTWANNVLQISVIVVSSLVTLLETVKSVMDFPTGFWNQLIPILLSTYIALAISIFKFFKMDENRESVNQLVLEMTGLLKRFITIRSRIRDVDQDSEPLEKRNQRHENPIDTVPSPKAISLRFNSSNQPQRPDPSSSDASKGALLSPVHHDRPSSTATLQKIKENFRQETYVTFLEAMEKFDILMPYPELIRYKKIFAIKMLEHKVIEGNIEKVERYRSEHPASGGNFQMRFVRRVSYCQKVAGLFVNMFRKKTRIEIDFEAFDSV